MRGCIFGFLLFPFLIWVWYMVQVANFFGIGQSRKTVPAPYTEDPIDGLPDDLYDEDLYR